VQQLAQQFSFVPFWRMDDIMISYAVDQGNVGAHVDNYDVFLVQAHGRREWLIEDKPRLEDEFVPGLPIRLLKKFSPTHRWILEPGDILYLPPRVPHHGIAQGDGCMTISVGFRAPTHDEIINSVVSNALAQSDSAVRYSDPDLSPQAPGEICPDSIAKVKEIISKKLLSDNLIADWVGSFATETYPDVDLSAHAVRYTSKKLASALSESTAVVRTEGARLAFIREAKNRVIFFYGGQKVELSGKSAKLAELLSNSLTVDADVIAPLLADADCSALLVSLFRAGMLAIDPLE
jgi:50S ribosomal protein L16 3-hydroxylase